MNNEEMKNAQALSDEELDQVIGGVGDRTQRQDEVSRTSRFGENLRTAREDANRRFERAERPGEMKQRNKRFLRPGGDRNS